LTPADRAVLAPAVLASAGFQARNISTGADIITAVNGKKLADEAAPRAALLTPEPGQEVTLRCIATASHATSA
jgi:S1-C subfamily serine protease